MKPLLYMALTLLIFGCASTQLTDSWKNPDYLSFDPNKVLVVGVTQNKTGRMLYEERLADALRKRGIKASQSALVFDTAFKDFKQTENEIDKQIDKLVDSGFDTAIVSAVTGVDERVTYTEGFPRTYYYYGRFRRYYFWYQDVYFEPGYYNKYKVYHIETSIYNLKPDATKSLIWVGSFSITDPSNISKTVNAYAEAVITALEEQHLIPRITEVY